MSDKKPHKTYTLEEFIESGENDLLTYANFSLLEKISDIEIPTENIIFDYISEIKKAAVTVKLTENEFIKYKYKPKLLAFDVYGTTESYFVIMALNNIIDVKDFTLKKLLMLKSNTMNEIMGYIYDANTNLLRSNRENL